MNFPDKNSAEPLAQLNADVPKMVREFLTTFKPVFQKNGVVVDSLSNQNTPGLKGSYTDKKNNNKPLLINK
jgi:hypothetical protein